ncbi:MAG: hypothetical protein IKZ59_00360 [Clostridia bacterium]|nr:hypothetical protein [Clostridia bacterium]
MQIAVKYFGILAVILSFSGFGFFKARQKSDGVTCLKRIISAFSKADSMLRTGGYSREKILKSAFSDIPGFICKNGDATFTNRAVKPEVSSAVNLFLANFGAGDATRERARIAETKNELLSALSSLEESLAAESKIWRTCGVCAGLIIGIMFV